MTFPRSHAHRWPFYLTQFKTRDGLSQQLLVLAKVALRSATFSQQVIDKVFLLSRQLEECRTELEQLQQRRERENQEGATLIRMLRADVDLAQSEGSVLPSSTAACPQPTGPRCGAQRHQPCCSPNAGLMIQR